MEEEGSHRSERTAEVQYNECALGLKSRLQCSKETRIPPSLLSCVRLCLIAHRRDARIDGMACEAEHRSAIATSSCERQQAIIKTSKHHRLQRHLQTALQGSCRHPPASRTKMPRNHLHQLTMPRCKNNPKEMREVRSCGINLSRSERAKARLQRKPRCGPRINYKARLDRERERGREGERERGREGERERGREGERERGREGERERGAPRELRYVNEREVFRGSMGSSSVGEVL